MGLVILKVNVLFIESKLGPKKSNYDSRSLSCKFEFEIYGKYWLGTYSKIFYDFMVNM